MPGPIRFTNLEPEPYAKMKAALDAIEKASCRIDDIDRQLKPLKEKRKRFADKLSREFQNFYDAIGKENPHA